MSTQASNLGTYYTKPANGDSPKIHFHAASLTDAQTVGQSLATLLGMALELYGDGVIGQLSPDTYTPADRTSGTVTVSAPDAVFLFAR